MLWKISSVPVSKEWGEPTTSFQKSQLSLTKEPVEVWDFRKITDRFKGIYGIYPKFVKKKLIMPKIYLDTAFFCGRVTTTGVTVYCLFFGVLQSCLGTDSRDGSNQSDWNCLSRWCGVILWDLHVHFMYVHSGLWNLWQAIRYLAISSTSCTRSISFTVYT